MAEEEDGEILLRKQGWYLGELSEDSATEILQTCQEYNVFIVYQTQTKSYLLSARFPVDGTDDGIIEHLAINSMEDGKYQLTGQDSSYDSVVEAVNNYTTSREPPLVPALGNVEQSDTHRQLEGQLSISSISAPPAYDEANRKLQPDIAPLPKIDNITTDNPVEAKTGRISPSGSLRIHRYDSYTYTGNREPTPPFINNPHWWRYRDKSCCHPRNVCHCCCHGRTRWNGRREITVNKWYDCRGNGFCRGLLLIFMWCLIWPCVGIGFCIFGCFLLCFFGCCYEDDD